MKNVIAEVRSANWGRHFEIRFATLNAERDVVAVAKPIEFIPVEAHAEVGEPTARLTRDHLQNLMDQLWYLGFRPERGEMSVGQVAAVNAHLQDMRTLAFAQLRVPKP